MAACVLALSHQITYVHAGNDPTKITRMHVTSTIHEKGTILRLFRFHQKQHDPSRVDFTLKASNEIIKDSYDHEILLTLTLGRLINAGTGSRSRRLLMRPHQILGAEAALFT